MRKQRTEPPHVPSPNEARLVFAERSADTWRENAGRERARSLELEAKLTVHDHALVQLALRLAAYGDPASYMSVSATPERG